MRLGCGARGGVGVIRGLGLLQDATRRRLGRLGRRVGGGFSCALPFGFGNLGLVVFLRRVASAGCTSDGNFPLALAISTC